MMSVVPFLMFEGEAEEAMSLYVSLFEDAHILEIVRYDEDGAGPAGEVLRGRFELCGREYACMDSPTEHDFGFTPSFSMFAEFDNEDDIEAVYVALSEGGNVLMPYQAYSFAKRFCWLQDRYGVSWQLNYEGSDEEAEAESPDP